MRKMSILALLAAFGIQSSAQSAVITIDDFSLMQTAEVGVLAPPTQVDSNTASGSGVIGGNRDLSVEKTLGDAGERVRTRVNPSGSNLLRQTIDEALGRTVVTWDGSMGDPGPGRLQVNFGGLGGVNFAGQSSQLDILLTFSDVGGPIRFTFWDADDLTGAKFATTTITAPGGVPTGSSVLLSSAFSTFSATGGTLVDILSSVGAIQMVIDATAPAQEAWDMRLSYVQTSGNPVVPEPSTFALAAIGLFVTGVSRRRRRNT